MKHFFLTMCIGGMLVLCGCGDANPVNVAADADQAKIDEYNRLNQEGMEGMEEADAEGEDAQ